MKKLLLTLIVSLAFCGSIFAQYEPYWEDIDIHQFEDHDPIVALMTLDNHLVLPGDNYEAYEVAAFVDEDDYRGHCFLKHYSEYGDPYPIIEFEIFYKPVGNSNEQPKPVHFKLFDHSTETLYDYWTCDVDIVTQAMYNNYDFSEMLTLNFFSTFTKEIDPYTEDGGYYLIASPIGEVNANAVVGLRTPNFDFYSFNQSAEDGFEWINHRDEEEYTLQPGMGYLYANSTGTDLTFIGSPFEGNGQVTLDYDENAEFPGWNLVGNPFAQTAYINRAFYTINAEGTDVIAGEGNEVGAMEGIFVVAQSQGESMSFTPVPSQKGGQIVLNVTNSDRGNTIDRAIVRIGNGDKLPKFMLNPENTKVYIQQGNQDFAVVRSTKFGRFPVNFEPAQDGSYTISVNAENLDVKYLHLIDHVMSFDIDLLQTPSYTFDAVTTETPDRFELVFKTGLGLFKQEFSTRDGGCAEDFSYSSNGNWIINNEGEAILQVIDLNGQILSSEEISGSYSKYIDAAPGIYMLRLIKGNDVKVQKVIVK